MHFGNKYLKILIMRIREYLVHYMIKRVNYDGSTIEIDLGETDNTYVQKTLEDNIDLIEDAILKVLKHKISVVVKAQIKVKEKEEKHPLLDDLKTKFTNSNNS